MQAVAAWLVARPLNSILALAATLSLAWLSFLSGAVIVLLALHKGMRSAALEAAAAGGLTAIVGALLQIPFGVTLQGIVTIWLPALLLTTVLMATRSLTLTAQLAYIVAVIAMALFFAIVADPVEFWQRILSDLGNMWREMGLSEQADMLVREQGAIAGQMTIVAVLMAWSVSMVSLMLGYKLYRLLPDRPAAYGRFRDLNFGRVLALGMALASVAALLTGWASLQNIAFVMFAMFWLQGLAIAHWSHAQGFLPTFGLGAVYVLTPILNLIMLMGLALTGYIDAWFGFRRLPAAK
jgi:hypothetical protein